MNDILFRLTRLHRQPRRRKTLRLAALSGAALVLASGAAHALCVLCDCTITSTGVGFGNYDTLSATALTSTGTLSFSCTSGIPILGATFTVSLNAGSSGTFAARTLKNGANTLNYNLYTSVAYTTVWGDGTASTATVSGTYPMNNAPPVTLTVYGLIPAQQNVLAGSYSDSITATVTF